MKKPTNIINKALSLIAAAFLTTAASDAQAVNFLWNNTGTQWTSPTSWTNGVQPTATTAIGTDVVQFSNFGPNFNTVDLTSTRTVQKLEFFSGANAYTFTSVSANPKFLEISSGGITNASSSMQTFNLRVNNSGGNYTWSTAAGGGLTFNQQVGLTTDSSGTSRTLTLAGDGAYVFNGNLVNNGTSVTPTAKVIYTGNGSITFNGTNTIGGVTGGGMEITGGGTVTVNGATGAGQGLIALGGTGGTTNMPILRINSTNGLSNLNSLKGSTSLATMGTLDLIGNNTNAVTTFVMNQYQGNNMNFTNRGEGRTLLQFTNAASTFTSSAGSGGGRRMYNNSTNLLVQFDGTVDIGSTAADNSMLGGVGDFLFKGALLNTGSALRGLTKTGTGTVTLEAVNTYNGDTLVQDGTLVVETAGSIASSAAVVSGGTMRVRGIAGGVAVNAGTLLVNSGGTVGTTTVGGGTLLVDGTAGAVTVNSGTATVNSGGSIGSTTINGSLLTMNGTAGDVLVNTGGTLGGSGSVQGLTLNGGTVAPGNSPGLLTAYELNGSNGTFQFQLGAPTTRGVTYDAIDVTSMLTLGASTAFTFETLDSYTYGMGDTYDLFNFDSINADAFDSAVLLAALPDLDTSNSNLQWNVTNFTTDGIVNVIPEPSTYASLLIGLILLALMKTKTKTKASLLAALLAVFSINTTHAAVLGIESASNYTSATWTEGAGSSVGTWYFQNDTAAVTQIADSSQGGRTSIGTDAFNFVPGNTAFNQFANGWFVLNGGGLIAGQTLSVDANYLWNGGNRGVEFMSGNAAVFRLQHVWSDPITFAGTGLTDTQVLANGYQQALTYSVDQLDQLSVQVSAYLYGSSSALFTQTVAVPDYITGIHFYAGDVTTTTADQPNYGLFVNNIEVSGIPEPSAGSLMLFGVAGILALKKLKRKEVRV